MDHKKKAEFKLSPGKTPKEPMQLMSKLDEMYRPAANSTGKIYKTELWVSAMDLANNLPHNRYVLGFDVLGFQVSSAGTYAHVCHQNRNWQQTLCGEGA